MSRSFYLRSPSLGPHHAGQCQRTASLGSVADDEVVGIECAHDPVERRKPFAGARLARGNAHLQLTEIESMEGWKPSSSRT